VILINGNMTAFLRRRSQEVQVFLPEDEPRRSQFGREVAKKLAELAIRRQGRKTGLLIGTINGQTAREHFLASFLTAAGFVDSAAGFQMRRIVPIAIPSASSSPAGIEEDTDLDDTDEESAETA
jgi:ATP-dependent Lhr-like helicase